jgi:inhibitor of cysteine peptidase
LKKLILVLAALLLVTLPTSAACGDDDDEGIPTPTPVITPAEDLEVADAADARNATLAYLREHEPQNAPVSSITWREEDVTHTGLVGAATKEFTADEWTIRISYPVVLPENTVYEVVISSATLGWHWKGNVKADGSVEVSIEASCDDFYDQAAISKEVEVAVGASFTVTLCSNPSTGFQWWESAQIGDNTVLQQTDHQFVMAHPEPPPPPGTPGEEVWTFKVLKEGTSTISVEYDRPWEGGKKAEWTFILTVTAR